MKDFEAAAELYSSGISKFASRSIQRGDEVLVKLGQKDIKRVKSCMAEIESCGLDFLKSNSISPNCRIFAPRRQDDSEKADETPRVEQHLQLPSSWDWIARCSEQISSHGF